MSALPPPPIVTINDLGHAYGPDRWVFRHYDAVIEQGTIFAILGPNGQGKSTLLQILMGVLRPSEGRATVRATAGFVPQIFQPGFPYTVLDMVLMGRTRQIKRFGTPARADEQAALDALERMGLADQRFKPFDQLSGGQRQLTIFARALASDARILVLDEPTSALDLGNQALVLMHLYRLSREQGLTIVFTTHHPHHAQAIADAALLMTGTDTTISGPADQVLTPANIEALYAIPMREAFFDFDGQRHSTLVPVFLRPASRQGQDTTCCQIW